MVLDIQAKEVIDKISRDLKVQPALQIPRAISDKIALVYNINPERILQRSVGFATDAASALILATHATKETFVVGVNISVNKDVLSTSTQTAILAQLFGESAATALFTARYEPLTAGQTNVSLTFPYPFRVAKGTNIQVTNSTAIASIDAIGMIYYYEVDPQ